MNDSDRSKAIEKVAEEYLLKEITPYVSDAWVDHSKTKIGYEIPFTRQFYKYQPPRPVLEIRHEIKSLEVEIQGLMKNLL